MEVLHDLAHDVGMSSQRITTSVTLIFLEMHICLFSGSCLNYIVAESKSFLVAIVTQISICPT